MLPGAKSFDVVVHGGGLPDAQELAAQLRFCNRPRIERAYLARDDRWPARSSRAAPRPVPVYVP